MRRHERLHTLLEQLARDGELDARRMSAQLSVSTATIRRDLDHLAEQQMLTRTHGGALASSISYSLPLRYKTARLALDLQRIGAAAAQLVQPGDTVGLVGGTITTEVARALVARRDLACAPDKGGITVVTTAINIATELAVRSTVRVVVTGGVPRTCSYQLVGPYALRGLMQIRLDMVILGIDGLDSSIGAMSQHEAEAATAALMVGRAERVVVVADSSALGRRAFARICRPADIDVLVTDTAASDAVVAPFTDAGMHVIRN